MFLGRGKLMLDSLLKRDVRRVVHWWAPPGYPHAVLAMRDPAFEWTQRQLSQQRFGNQFRLLRRKLAGKQSMLVAEGLRCTDAAISLWERGQRLPSQRMLRRAISVFNRLGATAEEIEKLRAAWMTGRSNRRSRRSQPVQSA